MAHTYGFPICSLAGTRCFNLERLNTVLATHLSGFLSNKNIVFKMMASLAQNRNWISLILVPWVCSGIFYLFKDSSTPGYSDSKLLKWQLPSRHWTCFYSQLTLASYNGPYLQSPEILTKFSIPRIEENFFMSLQLLQQFRSAVTSFHEIWTRLKMIKLPRHLGKTQRKKKRESF